MPSLTNKASCGSFGKHIEPEAGIKRQLQLQKSWLARLRFGRFCCIFVAALALTLTDPIQWIRMASILSAASNFTMVAAWKQKLQANPYHLPIHVHLLPIIPHSHSILHQVIIDSFLNIMLTRIKQILSSHHVLVSILNRVFITFISISLLFELVSLEICFMVVNQIWYPLLIVHFLRIEFLLNW